MIIGTSRFGQLEVDEERLIEVNVRALVRRSFYWLQAVDTPELAFVVCVARLLVADYQVPVKLEELQAIGLKEPETAQVFIIVNKVSDLLTGNFQGPLVINVENRHGCQLVLSDKRYSTRPPLMRLSARAALGKPA